MDVTKIIHEGHNVKRIREMLGIKQDALAIDLGLTQQAVSLLEQRETLDAPTLDKVAKALGVTANAIKNFNEDATMSNISCNFNDNAIAFQFNPIDKIVELYERLLKAEKEKK
jgi:transcriptional regulator with XRE-family HTH domain